MNVWKLLQNSKQSQRRNHTHQRRTLLHNEIKEYEEKWFGLSQIKNNHTLRNLFRTPMCITSEQQKISFSDMYRMLMMIKLIG